MHYDMIIIGSGAGGAATAYHLSRTGRKVLVLEKGMALPRDGSTLDVDKVFKRKLFLDDDAWLDRDGKLFVPQERSNLGGKTKWYGAALLRFAPHEFQPDPGHQCIGWPFPYEELEPFYEEAEQLLGVRHFNIEPDLQEIIGGLKRKDPHWQREPLPMGLAADVLSHPNEARHFDGFASARGLKADGEKLLDRARHQPGLQVLTGHNVVRLLAAPGDPRRVVGVLCADGSRFTADAVVLAAGALHSPRLLQRYFEQSGLAEKHPSYRLIGAHYKFHRLTAMLAFSLRPKRDVLRKTTLLLHDQLPHSSVQPLGYTDGELFATEAPAWMPRWVSEFMGARVYGFFLQTEDGSHPDNRVIAAPEGGRPRIDYDPARIPASVSEHRKLCAVMARELLGLGYVPLIKPIPLAGTAHACGTLAAGNDPNASVVDANARVHGMENLYVADGSVLPRSSRANPALSIYAWGLRLASRLGARGEIHGDEYSRADPVRA